MSEGVPAILSLGSNLGDRESTLKHAIQQIGELEGVALGAVSSIVETPALKLDGVDLDAPSYLNLVVAITTTRAPDELLAALNTIEHDNGRTREIRWGDRTLDIDIVTMGGQELVTDFVTLPHPRAAERAFVLVPWLEIEPDAALPGIGAISGLPAAQENVSRYRAEADS